MAVDVNQMPVPLRLPAVTPSHKYQQIFCTKECQFPIAYHPSEHEMDMLVGAFYAV
jgi:hypothetical protein